MHILIFNYLATACNYRDERVRRFLKIDENIWVDIFIAASVGYSDYFITEDLRILEICNHLYVV